MKTVIIFIGLKLLELIGVGILLVGIYFLGVWNPFGGSFENIPPESFWNPMINGLISVALILICLGVILLIGYGLYSWIKSNLDWADKLSNKS